VYRPSHAHPGTEEAMENTKYEFTGETKLEFGATLKRVRAIASFGIIAKGELGGWIESEASLSAKAAEKEAA